MSHQLVQRLKWLVRHTIGILLLVLSMGCSPTSDGSVIWYLHDGKEIRSINPRTMEQKVIVQGDEGTWIDRSALSSDGERIAYVLSRTSGQAVWLAKSDGSQARPITRIYAAVGFLWLSNTGLLLFGVDNQDTSLYEGEVISYDSVTGIAQRVDYPEGLSVNPQNRSNGPPGKFRIFQPPFALRRPVGLGHLQITDGQVMGIVDIPINGHQYPDWSFSNLSWTQDTSRIVANASVMVGSVTDLFVTDDQGKTVRRLTFFADDYESDTLSEFAVAPNGKWVAFYVSVSIPRSQGKNTGTSLMLVSTDQSASKVLAETVPQDRIVWSPDSKYVATSFGSPGVSEAPFQLYTVNVETGEKRQMIFEKGQVVFDWR